MISRIKRDTALVCGLIALAAAMWRRDLAAPLGVLGGGLLIGLSFWAIQGTVDAFMRPRFDAKTPVKGPRFQLVKFFTRHGMLALVAYGMMVRLRVDPVGLIAGVSSLGVAVAVEALRDLRWRRFL